MKLLMIKCHQKTLFSWLQPIQTEPYELEILASAALSAGADCRIFDSLLEKGSLRQVLLEEAPDVVLLSGYITAVDTMAAYARLIRKARPGTVVVAGGVHASVCPEDFMVPSIDLVVHSDGTRVLQQLLATDFQPAAWPTITGLIYRKMGHWVTNPAQATRAESLPPADRTYFQQHLHKTRYLHYAPVALLQTALSCPHTCNFCYCRHLNSGVYSTRPVECVIQEIEKISCETIWIVDDTFLVERKRAEAFIDSIIAAGIQKQFIAYARADFLVTHGDLIPRLKQAGFVEFIIGLESLNPKELTDYDKHCTARENQQAVERLTKEGIRVTGLFIAHIDYRPEDFRRLRQWIRSLNLHMYTLSIYTPMKGLPDYEKARPHLTTRENKKWDFLHLVLPPTGMSRFRFYCEVWFTYGQQLIHNRSLRKFLWLNLRMPLPASLSGLKQALLRRVIGKESTL